PGNARSMVCFAYTRNAIAHDIVMTNLWSGGIQPEGWSTALIFNCHFYAKSGSGATGIRVYGEGDNAWTRLPSWGDKNKVYVEDFTFSWSGNAYGAFDMYWGGRLCFRYNMVTNINMGNHGLDSTGVRSSH